MKPKQNQLAYALAASEDEARRIAWKAYRLLCYHKPDNLDDVKSLVLQSVELQTQK